jgi:hypothetical protein
MTTSHKPEISRRNFILTAGSLAALPLLVNAQGKIPSKEQTAVKDSGRTEVIGRRKLGTLEVLVLA